MKAMNRFLRASLAAASLFSSNVGAKTLLYIGGWPHQLMAVDESTYQVVKRIEMKTDVPRNLVLSNDRSKLVVLTLKDTGIETVDLAKQEVVDSFTLGSRNDSFSVSGIALDPTGKLLYAHITEAKKLIDRFEIGKPSFAVIDLTQRKIVKTVELPPADPAEAGGGGRGGSLCVSPDGKFLYQFGAKISIFDTSTLKKVQTIDLSKPEFPNMEAVTFAPEMEPSDDPNVLTGSFHTEDPVVHRRIYGIATFHLNERKFDFKPIGPATDGISNVRFTPDRKKAYVVTIEGTHGDRHCEFWSIDAPTSKITKRQEFACRPRFSFTTSTAADKLYIYSAGFELEVYDAATMQLEKTLSLDADVTTPMVAVTASSSGSSVAGSGGTR
jgi:hypothetical protein